MDVSIGPPPRIAGIHRRTPNQPVSTFCRTGPVSQPIRYGNDRHDRTCPSGRTRPAGGQAWRSSDQNPEFLGSPTGPEVVTIGVSNPVLPTRRQTPDVGSCRQRSSDKRLPTTTIDRRQFDPYLCDGNPTVQRPIPTETSGASCHRRPSGWWAFRARWPVGVPGTVAGLASTDVARLEPNPLTVRIWRR